MSDEIAVVVDDVFDVANAGNPSVIAHTHPASQISDSTVAGRALLTSVDVGTQKKDLSIGPEFETLAALQSDTTLSYSSTAFVVLTVGQIVRTRSEGFSYQVLAQDSATYDIITSGSVKLGVLPNGTTYSAKAFGAVGDGVTDDTVALQKFFDCANTNSGKYLIFDWSGTYKITSTIYIKGDGNTYVSGELYCDAVLDVGLKINGRYCRHIGLIVVHGSASSNNVITYTARNITSACVDVECCFNTKFDGFYVQGSKRDGVRCLTSGYNADGVINSIISAVLGNVIAWNCGSGGWVAATPDVPQLWNQSFSFSARTDTGLSGVQSGASAQRSVLTVASIPTELAVDDVVRFGKEFHVVKAIDRTAGTISVYPWIWDGDGVNYGVVTSGTIFSCHGSGLNISGSNSAGVVVNNAEMMRCGIAIYCGALYGPTIKGLVAEMSGVTLGIYGINVGLTVTGFHPEVAENTAKGILVIDYVEPRGVVVSGFSVSRPYDVWIMLASFSTNPVTRSWKSFTGVTFLDGAGGAINSQGRAYGTASLNAFSLSNVPGNDSIVTTRAVGDSTATLTYNSDYDRLFGRKTVTIYQGTINSSGGGQALKIKPSAGDFAAGITVMGVATGDGTYTIPAATNARKVEAVYEPDNKRWLVIRHEWDESLKASATWNPPSVNAAASTTTTVTVTGASLGDYVDVSFSLSLQGMTLTGYVSAADTVTVVLFNPTAGALDLASGTLGVIVTKP